MTKNYKALHQCARDKDLAGYRRVFAEEVTPNHIEGVRETLDELMIVTRDPGDLCQDFEFCLGKDGTITSSKNKGIFIDWEMTDFLEPALIAGNGRFVYTAFDLLGVDKWRKTIIEFKNLAELVRGAQSLEDIKDYFFDISCRGKKVLLIDFQTFQKKFPIFLDELIEWLEHAVEQDDSIWLRGL